MSDLVGNPEHPFSHNEAQMLLASMQCFVLYFKKDNIEKPVLTKPTTKSSVHTISDEPWPPPSLMRFYSPYKEILEPLHKKACFLHMQK